MHFIHYIYIWYVFFSSGFSKYVCDCRFVYMFIYILFFLFFFFSLFLGMKVDKMGGLICVWLLYLGMAFSLTNGVYIVPGALVEEGGSMWLADSYIYVHKNLSDLNVFPERVLRLEEGVQNLKSLLGQIGNPKLIVGEFKSLCFTIKTSVLQLEDKIQTAKSWFPGLSKLDNSTAVGKHSRRKRAAVAAVVLGGGILAITGTAIAALVKVKQLETVVESQGRELFRLKENQNNLKLSLDDAIDKVEELQVDVSSLSSKVDLLVVLFRIQTEVSILINEVDYILEQLHVKVQIVLDGVQDRVTPKIFPLGELHDILVTAAFKWRLHALFVEEELINYYSFFSVDLAEDGLIVKIPVSSLAVFQVFNVHPFPSFVSDSVKILRGSEIVMIKNKFLFATLSMSSMKSCKSARSVTVCPVGIFLLNVVGNPTCEYNVVMNVSRELDCVVKMEPPVVAFISVSGYIGVFIRDATPSRVTCLGTQRHVPERGTFVLPVGCNVEMGHFVVKTSVRRHVDSNFTELHYHHKVDLDDFSTVFVPQDFKYTKPKKALMIVDTPFFLSHYEHSIVTWTILGVLCAMIIALVLVGCYVKNCRVGRRSISTLEKVDLEVNPAEGVGTDSVTRNDLVIHYVAAS